MLNHLGSPIAYLGGFNFELTIFMLEKDSVKLVTTRRAWQPTPVFLPGESPFTEEPTVHGAIKIQT